MGKFFKTAKGRDISKALYEVRKKLSLANRRTDRASIAKWTAEKKHLQKLQKGSVADAGVQRRFIEDMTKAKASIAQKKKIILNQKQNKA